jgi:hypothetical protein
VPKNPCLHRDVERGRLGGRHSVDVLEPADLLDGDRLGESHTGVLALDLDELPLQKVIHRVEHAPRHQHEGQGHDDAENRIEGSPRTPLDAA